MRVSEVRPGDIPATHRYPPDWQPQGGVYACLEVTDQGCGIAQEDIDKLFDPFFSSKFTGRGLGLPVVLGIVKAHDGVVTVESEIGVGSIFRIFLLVSGEAMPREPARKAAALEIHGGGVVLLADDEAAVREMTQAMFERLGFSVITARDGVEATELFRQHRGEIRFVFCDLTMPRMDGLETFRTLREMDPDVRILLSSGYSREMIIDRFNGMEFPVFLHKPFTMEELSASIRDVLAG